MKFTRKVLVSLTTIGALLTPAASAFGADEVPADAVSLSLSECLQKALENNLDLAIAKMDPEISYQDVTFQKARFDPLFRSDATYSKFKGEPSTIFQSSSQTQEELSAGVSGLFNFGATWSAGLTSTKTDSNSSFNAYNPNYNSGLALGFNLPLLKGLGKKAVTADLVISKTNLDISHVELRRRAIATLRTVEDGYWNLRAAIEAQRVADQTLKLSQDLYDLNKKKVDVGTLAPIEITQAEANVASNVELTIRARETVQNSEDNLRQLLAIPKSDPMWLQPINPTEPPDDTTHAVDVEAAIATAFENRPEMIEAKKTLDNASVSEYAARNAAKHELNLGLSVTPSGNNLIDVLPTGPVVGGLEDSLKEVPKFRNYTWQVGLTYIVPIANRAAEANYAVAKISREKQEISVQNTEDLIRLDVRTAARAVEAGYERVVAGRKNVELQKKKLEAEQKKFENGMSTSFEVFTFQTDLRNAQLSLIQALLDYNKSLADLERAKGTLLEAKGLKLAEDAGK